MGFFKRLSRNLMAGEPAAPRGKAGCRAYAIGDIHGRLDLLESLLDQIELDRQWRAPKKTFIIFLGDLIDRGPDSAGVVERLRHYRPESARTIFLAGNHEEVLLRILRGDSSIIQPWLKFGGAECVRSYGLNAQSLLQMDEAAVVEKVRAAVPPAHREFLESFADTFRFGDYLFVHAGIRPGVAIDAQDRQDLLWIREPFLTDTKEHGCMVVHGHTIVERVEERRNRIAIDTGAYQTGILTALAIEDDQRWLLATPSGDRSTVRIVSAAA
jgi:serine/threonine protein phosphatase 1